MREAENSKGFLSKERLKRGMAIALLLFAIVAVVLLVLTVGEKTKLALKAARWEFLLLAFISWSLYLSFDGLRLLFLARAMGGRLYWHKCVNVVAIGIFLAAVTPFQVSGFPVQVFLLSREGLAVSTSTLIMAGRGLISAIPVLLFLIPSIRLSELPSSAFYRAFYGYVSLTGFLLLGILVVAFFKPRLLFRIVPNRFSKARDFVKRESGRLEETGRILRSPRSLPALLASLFFSFGTWIFYLLILPFILLSFNVDVPIIRALSLTLLLQVSLLWSPSPGAVGFAEALGSAILLQISPKELIGIVIILWRILTFYITAIMGGILFALFSLSLGKQRAPQD